MPPYNGEFCTYKVSGVGVFVTLFLDPDRDPDFLRFFIKFSRFLRPGNIMHSKMPILERSSFRCMKVNS